MNTTKKLLPFPIKESEEENNSQAEEQNNSPAVKESESGKELLKRSRSGNKMLLEHGRKLQNLGKETQSGEGNKNILLRQEKALPPSFLQLGLNSVTPNSSYGLSTASPNCSYGTLHAEPLMQQFIDTTQNFGSVEKEKQPQVVTLEDPNTGSEVAKTPMGSMVTSTGGVKGLMSTRKQLPENQAMFIKKLKELKERIPNCNKVDAPSILDDAIKYLSELEMSIKITKESQCLTPIGQMELMKYNLNPVMYPGFGNYIPIPVGIVPMQNPAFDVLAPNFVASTTRNPLQIQTFPHPYQTSYLPRWKLPNND